MHVSKQGSEAITMTNSSQKTYRNLQDGDCPSASTFQFLNGFLIKLPWESQHSPSSSSFLPWFVNKRIWSIKHLFGHTESHLRWLKFALLLLFFLSVLVCSLRQRRRLFLRASSRDWHLDHSCSLGTSVQLETGSTQILESLRGNKEPDRHAGQLPVSPEWPLPTNTELRNIQ